MRIRERLDKLGLELPEPFVYPNENRTGCVVTRYLLYTSGHPPPEDFGVKVRGKVGADISEEEAHASARATALSILASVENELGSLDRVTQVVKVTGMVNSAPASTGSSRSSMAHRTCSTNCLDRRQHARSAVGVRTATTVLHGNRSDFRSRRLNDVVTLRNTPRATAADRRSRRESAVRSCPIWMRPGIAGATTAIPASLPSPVSAAGWSGCMPPTIPM